VACLLLDDENRTPYDMAVPLYKESFLQQATIDLACALIEMALSPKATTIPLLVMNHIKSMIPKLVRDANGRDSTTTEFALVESIRTSLKMKQVSALLRNKHVQRLIHEETLQHLISGTVQMNLAGRNYIQDDPSNKVKGLRVLNAVSSNPDCVYLHLRESPCLCEREPFLA
jgi:hypothetical protein